MSLIRQLKAMASGDQPALIAEMVDWARTIGMKVVCAGNGTQSALEMAAVANGCELAAPALGRVRGV